MILNKNIQIELQPPRDLLFGLRDMSFILLMDVLGVTFIRR
jgi:hypothetical protein